MAPAESRSDALSINWSVWRHASRNGPEEILVHRAKQSSERLKEKVRRTCMFSEVMGAIHVVSSDPDASPPLLAWRWSRYTRCARRSLVSGNPADTQPRLPG